MSINKITQVALIFTENVSDLVLNTYKKLIKNNKRLDVFNLLTLKQ